MIPHLQGPHQAGLFTAISIDGTVTSFNLHELPGINTAAISYCQWQYYQQGFQLGLAQKLTALRSAPAPAPAPVPRTPERSTAPKLNPPKVFKGNRTEFKHFMLDLNMICRSDSGRYQNNNEAKITYAASLLSGPAKDWFQHYVNETTGAINFTWVTFVEALKSVFDDPDAYQTARCKLETLKQERNDCSTYLSSFTPLATTLNPTTHTFSLSSIPGFRDISTTSNPINLILAPLEPQRRGQHIYILITWGTDEERRG